jgi:hypothetical protein
MSESVKARRAQHVARTNILDEELTYLAKFGRRALNVEEPLSPDTDNDWCWAYLGWCLTKFENDRPDPRTWRDQATGDIQILTRALAQVRGRIFLPHTVVKQPPKMEKFVL